MPTAVSARTRIAAVFASCALLTTGLIGAAIPAAASSPPITDESGVEAELAWSAEPAASQTSSLGLEEAPHDADVDVSAAAPVTWAACGAFDDATKLVRTFSGPNYLRCGNDAFGYRHLLARGHDADWAAKAAATGQNWRDVADIAIEKTLTDPVAVVERPSNDTKCYSAVVYLINTGTGETVASTIAHTVAGIRSQNIVTSFPASSHCS